MKKLIAVMLCLAACRDAEIAQFKALGADGHIVCYSADKVIFDGWSSGKISTVSQSDGWEFMDRDTKRLVRVSGACVITN
jgi:hypothetical protein